MELDHESYAEFGKRIREIRELITTKYGEEVYFEFCQHMGWGVHNGQYEWVEGIGAIDREQQLCLYNEEREEEKVKKKWEQFYEDLMQL